MLRRFGLGVLAALFAALAWAQGLQPVPPLSARVTDLTGTLTPQEKAALETTLAALEARKGAQLAVLLVPTTQPETIEEYARRVLDEWKLGRRGVDDGALLLVAKDDRRVRIETQYGLEGVIPDAVAKRIIEEDIVPRFREGDFAGGIRAGVERMVRLVEGEALPPPKPASRGEGLEGLLPALALVVLFFGRLLELIFGPALGAAIGGTVVGVIVALLTGSAQTGLVVGLIAFVFLLVGIGRAAGGRWNLPGGGADSGLGGGWSSGGLGGGFGGGFRGGGGWGGGGGASGRW